MVLQLLHETNLCLLLYRLVSRTVLTYAECVVSPDEFNWKLHESCHTYSRLHIVREYEECTASWDYTTVESHTDAAACHSKLCNTCLEECTREVVLCEVVSLLQEAVSLIRVRQVGRSTDHIWNLLCKG